MGYTPMQAGLWMIPGAIAVGVTMPIAGRLADRYSPAMLTAAGCLLVGGSLLQFGELDPLSSSTMIIMPQVVRGFGLALMMAPLMAAAINAVPRHQVPMATSFLNVSQNVGGSLGIALLNNFVTNAIHIHAVRIGEGFPVESAPFYRLGLDVYGMVIREAHGIFTSPQMKAVFAGSSGIMRQAQVLGFDNGFVFAGIVVLCGIPLCLMLEPAAHHLREEEKEEEKLEAELLVD